MRLYISLLFSFFICSYCNAQRAGLMLGGGTVYYTGEMNDRVITHEKLLKPYGNIGLLFRLSSRVDVWANYMHGTLVGDDSLGINYEIRNRNLSFKSTIDELGINIGFKLLGDNKGKQRKASPFIFTGVAGFHFKPKAELNGDWIDLQSVGTEGQYIKEGNYPRPYELYQVSVPAGIGVEINISKVFSLRLEAARHFLFTDYLDDVSGSYADSASLAATPKGSIAVAMASQQRNGSYPADGTDRGDVKTNDSYTHIGVSILWTPVKDGNQSSTVKKEKEEEKM